MEQDQNAIPQSKRVGKASNAAVMNPKDPQWWLAGSVHPYAPFVGNALKWESYVYDDGTTYEGTMMLDVPHGKGTIIFGNGGGGGIQRSEPTDKYEGEFDTGFAHGLGQYSSTNKSKVFRGEYSIGQRHGCGAEYDMSPYIKKVNEGEDADTAWAETKDEIENKAKYGTWLRDAFFTGPDDSGRWCHINEIKGTIQEVKEVLARTRMFQHKPDGEVTFRFLQDDNGAPAPVMQDPLHYPLGTGFLAPGPMGQCHPIPNDPKLKSSMVKAAENHQHIHDSYNLPYDPEPGSIMDKAMKLWKKKETRRQRALDKKLQRESQRIRRVEAASAAANGDDGALGGNAAADAAAAQEDIDDDDNDLIAAAVMMDDDDKKNKGGSQGPSSVIASVSMSVDRMSRTFQAAMHKLAVTAPSRRSLIRPQRRGGA